MDEALDELEIKLQLMHSRICALETIIRPVPNNSNGTGESTEMLSEGVSTSRRGVVVQEAHISHRQNQIPNLRRKFGSTVPPPPDSFLKYLGLIMFVRNNNLPKPPFRQ
ncbi:unnamed protein product [Notodromas monacha]|uniref:Uncharacterized protein n=1 Tax=Notodromas monacha TaxID=399045 RepID=A0A7R9GGD4_9CRUS|nr:unnamed protein product [Notodromas monacha]CAG0920093.1 unnamed protein product [Notodromas monacha]